MKSIREYINLIESAQIPVESVRTQYKVIFVDPTEGSKVVGQVSNLVDAKKIIRDNFKQIYDSGDNLRKVAPNIFVLEPDYRNTDDLASINNYKHMYHWIIQ